MPIHPSKTRIAAVEHVEGRGPLVLSCEHASNALPDGWSWPERDRWLVETHWAWDIGAADLTRSLARLLGVPAVLTRFSRLLIDPNRAVTSPTLIRDVADGKLVHLNRKVKGEERERRIQTLYRPYHASLRDTVLQNPGARVLSIHSFTPIYEGGPPRPMEVGVLFDDQEAAAFRLAEAIRSTGTITALNEPYSGRNGLMYAAQTAAAVDGREALEIEVRQDLAGDPERCAVVVERLALALESVGWV